MKVGAGQKSTASPNVTEAKWVPMGTFFSFWVHFVNNLFPLYSNELAYFLQFCLLGPYSAGGGSHLVHFSLKKMGPHFDKIWSPSHLASVQYILPINVKKDY